MRCERPGTKGALGGTILFTTGLCLLLFVSACSTNDLPEPIDCNESPIVVTLTSSSDTECGLSDGVIEVNASGGVVPYRYTVNNGEQQTHGIFTSLASGTYTISVTDEAGCSGTLDVTIANKEGLNIQVETTASGCGSSVGSITVSAVQGVAPVQYKFGTGDFQDVNNIHDLKQGDYTITARDATGCEVSQKVHVTSGVSFATNVSPIMQANCAITGCHNGTQPPDFRSFQTIREFAPLIRVQVVTRTMPVDRTLTATQINTILCWIDDGAPAN